MQREGRRAGDKDRASRQAARMREITPGKPQPPIPQESAMAFEKLLMLERQAQDCERWDGMS